MTLSRQDNITQEAEKNTVWQSIQTGSAAGAAEVMITHPVWAIGIRVQKGDPFTFNPFILYRGVTTNAGSMIPITALQVSLNCFLQNTFFKDSHKLSISQAFASSFVAGVGSAFITCPAERIMIDQSKRGGSFYAVGKRLIQQGGRNCLFNALPATGMREGIFAAFYLAVPSILKKYITPFSPNDFVSSMTAGVTAGIIATVLSHCFDTIKTKQQIADPAQSLCFKNAAKLLYSERGFFRGILARGINVTASVAIMSYCCVNDKSEAKFRLS